MLLNAEAAKLNGCEFLPAVAVPVAGRFKMPRTVLPPLISSVAAGVVVPMPILVVVPDTDWKITWLMMLLVLSHSGR